MLNLPILNVQLRTCHADWQQMTPTEQGRHCAVCQRTVIDFTAAAQADLENARAAAPDGRVCGRFRAEQLAAPPKLRLRLRRFLVALVLVCGLGLSAREAVAQVKPVLRDNAAMNSTMDEVWLAPLVQADELRQAASKPAEKTFLGYIEQMPVFRGGMERLPEIIRQNNHFPVGIDSIKGKVFVSFTINEQGRVVKPVITKGLHPKLDAEALRLVQLLDGEWSAGSQNGRPVPVQFTLPIIFDSTPGNPVLSGKKSAKRARR
ncbi:energy transducer TonB [Hymenobacter guriensis]|uniref:Energy transducer TonB n=1 Tax=Hymenobacter guriensis TaxID=2793065 RepID=A0ABS0L502_9BACT|nr:energy transducer TonB [Hymenobacter guriensis]MBG8555154.1 energy transducer TonB [Hymenobacter guriensis]